MVNMEAGTVELRGSVKRTIQGVKRESGADPLGG